MRACVLRVANAQAARVPNDLERLQSFGTEHRRPVPRITQGALVRPWLRSITLRILQVL